MQALKDKVAIITGAGSGIGRAAAILFAREGARLVLAGRSSEKLKAVADTIDASARNVTFVAGDVRDDEYARSLVANAEERFGGLDIAFNNAGIVGDLVPFEQITDEGWRETIDTNLTGCFFGARHQAPAMLKRGRGSLIFTGTFVGYSAGMPGMCAYAASKAGLIGLTQSLAVELGAKNIRVNALLPGGTDTPINPMNAENATPEVRTFIEGLHSLKRVASPEEIAQAALFLASDASSFVHGTALLADGGVSITRT